MSLPKHPSPGVDQVSDAKVSMYGQLKIKLACEKVAREGEFRGLREIEKYGRRRDSFWGRREAEKATCVTLCNPAC